jgi:WD40 repeat protein
MRLVPTRRRWLPWLVAGVALVLVAAVVAYRQTRDASGVPNPPPKTDPPLPLEWRLEHSWVLSRGPIQALAFAPDSSRLAVGIGGWTNAPETKDVLLIDPVTGQRDVLGSHALPIRCLAFSHDGAWLASGTGHVTQQLKGEVKLWDLEAALPRDGARSGAAAVSFEAHIGGVGALLFLKDRRLVTAGIATGVDPSVKLWPARGDLRPTILGEHARGIQSAALSPDGKLLVTASEDGKIKLWDTAEQVEVGTLAGPAGRFQGLAFSPDGGTLAVVTGPDPNRQESGTVRLWGVAARRLLAEQPGDGQALPGLTSAAYDPSGRVLAAGDQRGSVLFLDASTGASLGSLSADQEATLAVAFSGNGRYLATSGFRDGVKLWQSKRD